MRDIGISQYGRKTGRFALHAVPAARGLGNGFFVKSRDYHFDVDAVRIPYDAETKKARTRSIFVGKKWLEVGYNPKNVWSVSRLHRQHGERENHPTQKPLEIVERMVLASCPSGGTVLDPFMGSGTSAVAASRHGRRFIGFELNADYFAIAEKRVAASVSGRKDVKREATNVSPVL